MKIFKKVMTNQNKHLFLSENSNMFREAIISAIEKKGMSQAELCRQLGLNRHHFNAFLKGSTFPMDDIERVIKYLGLEVTEKRRHTITAVQDGKEIELEIKRINLEL